MKKSLEIQKEDKLVARAAILCPDEFDNYLFWELICPNKSTVADIEKAAECAGINIQSRAYPDIFFPSLEKLIANIARTSSNPRKIFESIKLCYLEKNNPEFNQWIDSQLPSFHHAHQISNQPPNAPSDDGSNGPKGPNSRGPRFTGPLFIGQAEANTVSAGVAPTTKPSFSLKLNILGGFMVALGVVALVLALTVLNTATLSTASVIAGAIAGTCMVIGANLFFKPAHSSLTLLGPQSSNTATP